MKRNKYTKIADNKHRHKEHKERERERKRGVNYEIFKTFNLFYTKKQIKIIFLQFVVPSDI